MYTVGERHRAITQRFEIVGCNATSALRELIVLIGQPVAIRSKCGSGADVVLISLVRAAVSG